MVTQHDAGEQFLGPARELLEVLSRSPGFVSGHVGRSPDEPDVWLMVTHWQDVGSMRRGFGTYDAKVAAAPVMASARNQPSAFEELVEVRDGNVSLNAPDRHAP